MKIDVDQMKKDLKKWALPIVGLTLVVEFMKIGYSTPTTSTSTEVTTSVSSNASIYEERLESVQAAKSSVSKPTAEENLEYTKQMLEHYSTSSSATSSSTSSSSVSKSPVSTEKVEEPVISGKYTWEKNKEMFLSTRDNFEERLKKAAPAGVTNVSVSFNSYCLNILYEVGPDLELAMLLMDHSQYYGLVSTYENTLSELKAVVESGFEMEKSATYKIEFAGYDCNSYFVVMSGCKAYGEPVDVEWSCIQDFDSEYYTHKWYDVSDNFISEN